MAARVTAINADVIIEPIPQARLTALNVDLVINPTAEPNVRLTALNVDLIVLPSTSANPCADPWMFPEPNPYPFPLNGGPQFLRFQEIKPEWGEFGGAFPDGVPTYNTIQTAAVRRWQVEYDGLSQDEALVLDTHFRSTRGGISFNMTVPRTGEALTGVRYESYQRSAHQKVWSQARSVVLVRYTNG